MSVNLPKVYAEEFATKLKLLLQQIPSRLRGTVESGTHTGAKASPVDQMGSVEMREVVTRFGPMVRTDPDFDRRWVLPKDYDLNQLIDPKDKLRIIVELRGKYLMNALAAANRRFDNTILTKYYAANQTGTDAGTSTVFLAGNQIADSFGAAAAVGLTMAKVKEAKRLHMSHNLDMATEEFHAAITSKQHDNLLNEVQVISREFNGGEAVLKEGVVIRVLGYNLHHTELVPVDGSSDRRCPFYAKSGVHLGIWDDIKTDVRQRGDLESLPWQVYLQLTIDATRIEEKKCVEVKCDEP